MSSGTRGPRTRGPRSSSNPRSSRGARPRVSVRCGPRPPVGRSPSRRGRSLDVRGRSDDERRRSSATRGRPAPERGLSALPREDPDPLRPGAERGVRGRSPPDCAPGVRLEERSSSLRRLSERLDVGLRASDRPAFVGREPEPVEREPEPLPAARSGFPAADPRPRGAPPPAEGRSEPRRSPPLAGRPLDGRPLGRRSPRPADPLDS